MTVDLDWDTLMDRIERKTHVEGDCLIWDGTLRKGKPETMAPDRRNVMVHKELARMKFGEYERAVRSCGNILCVNPEHVEDGKERNSNSLVRKARSADWGFVEDEAFMGQLRSEARRSARRLDVEEDDVFQEACLWLAVRKRDHSNYSPHGAAREAAQLLRRQADGRAEWEESLEELLESEYKEN